MKGWAVKHMGPKESDETSGNHCREFVLHCASLSHTLFSVFAFSFPFSLPIPLFFCVRKTGSELTSCCQSSSFSLRKIVAGLTCEPVFLYFICGTPATTWQCVSPCPESPPANPGPLKRRASTYLLCHQANPNHF